MIGPSIKRNRVPRAVHRAYYSVSELAVMANVTRHSMSRLLVSVGVPFHLSGTKRLVFLADIRRMMPTLWESIQLYGDL